MVAKMLDRSALVLNRNWQPVNVATVARALVLLWNEAARVVDCDDYRTYSWADWSALRVREGERFIQAVRLRLRVPEVIVLASYDRLPEAAVSFSRRNIFKRDHWACQYCGCQPGGDELTIDHVVPRSQGGAVDLGQLRAGVHRVQQAEGRPDAGAGTDEAPQAARPPVLEADVRPAQPADRKLVEVRQRGVLEREFGTMNAE